jgi:hypothetical protein
MYVLSACGGFLFSRKSVRYTFFVKTPLPPPEKKLPRWRSPYWLVSGVGLNFFLSAMSATWHGADGHPCFRTASITWRLEVG